jgi:serine/threonine protein kinase
MTDEEPTRTEPAKTTDIAALEPGQAILEYRIDKVLGGGGFGITYLAQDLNLQLPVAIKEYFPSGLAVRSKDNSGHIRATESASQFEWGLDRFVDEARALASFRHPNIVRVLRYFKQNGTAYIVMEYESGDPLKRWLNQQSGLDQRTLLQLVYPLLDGLEAVHKLDFLHRDIKPDNIYIRADGSPVLLDFGAARRVTVDQDMTNIVTPGFAPFEQYHTRGNQGPWTDLYSLGAVMYWMTTGAKPVESASRVREDVMPKAVDIASRAAFGEQLLHAIDWALTPDEKQRPQNVDELRRALQESEHLKTEARDTVRLAHTALMPRSDARASGTSHPEEDLRKNVMGTIMFLDLVAYSTHSVDQQVAIKTLFNELITKAIGGVDESSRIMLDTGDGAAICFLGDPEEVLQSARLLRDLLRQKYGQKLSVRVGLHLGPVRMLRDINNRVNVVGDGINVAQRIMDFSTANQIMVSRAYYDVVSRISDGADAMFEFLGARLDKHKRSHEIYALVDPHSARPASVGKGTDFAPTMRVASTEPIATADVQAIEADLTRAIGPLAQVLVRKAVHRATDAQGLREILSVSIQDVAARESFIHPKKSSDRPGVSALVNASSKLVPTSRPTASGPASAGLSKVSAEQQSQLERALSQHIGPLSKTLVRKEASRHADWSDLLQALAMHIDKPEDRALFLASAKKIQANR